MRTEKPFLLLDQTFLLPHEVLFDLLAKALKLTERLVLRHVILHVRAQVDLEQVAKVGDVVARAGTHLRQPGVKFMKAIDSDHVVDVPQLL